jgi:O-antigen/teichoic acid export membrane protein
MVTRERVRKNIGSKFIGEIASRLISFSFNLVLARCLGATLYGRYSFAAAFAGIIALCGEFGLNILLTREVAKNKEHAGELVRHLAPLRVFLVLLVAGITAALGYFWAGRERIVEIVLLSGFMATNTMLDYHSSIFNAFERMGNDAGLRIVTRISVSVLGIIAILGGMSFWWILVAINLGNLLAVGAGSYWRKQLGLTWGWAWNWRLIKNTIKAAFPVGMAIISGVVYLYMDSIALEALGFSDALIGQYAAAAKILEASQGLPLVILGGIFPVAAELSSLQKTAVLVPFFEKVTRFCMLVCVPLAAVAALLSPRVALFLYGPEYVATGAALCLLAIGAPFFYSNLIASGLFVAQGSTWFVASFRLVTAMAKLSILWIVSPWLGVISPAVGMLAADGALFLFLLAYRSRKGLFSAKEKAVVTRVAWGIAGIGCLGGVTYYLSQMGVLD